MVGGVGMVGIGIVDWGYQIVDKDADSAICMCNKETAKWLISRLSLAADIEELAYNVVVKQYPTDDLEKYVKGKLK